MRAWKRCAVRVVVLVSLVSGCGSESTDDARRGQGDVGVEEDVSGAPDGGVSDGGGNDAGGDGGDVDASGNDPQRPGGLVAEVWSEAPLAIDDARRDAARQAYQALDKDTLADGFDPDAFYEVFNEFALTHFGPFNQPLLEVHTGQTVDFLASGAWHYASRSSATVAFETTRPVIGWVEWGTSPEALNAQSEASERPTFLQIHHLRELPTDTTIYYRWVGRDVTGETIASVVHELQTSDPAPAEDLIELPGTLEGPPYRLDQSGATYLLTEDLSGTQSAVVQIVASDITLDLGGHTITYGEGSIASTDAGHAEQAASGVWARSNEVSGVRVLNGRIIEGGVGNSGASSSGGLHGVYLSGVSDVELAGLDIAYQAAQIHAVHLRYPEGEVEVHHNRFKDRGYVITNRHGSGGGRPVQITDTSQNHASPNAYALHHNLVLRTRQNGLRQANTITDNEIYVDSWSTNSFAIQPHSAPDTVAGKVLRNTIFMSGYHSIAVSWAHLDLEVAENLVQMEGVRTESRRYFESWGDMDSLNGFRITNYGSGGQVRHNLAYRDNLIVGRARSGGIMRGTELFSDATITETHCEGNLIDIRAVDEVTLDAAPVVTQGVHDTRPDHQPTYYVDNHLRSNVALVRFGDSYGRGNRHTFINPRFEKVGDHPDFATFIFDGGYESYDHLLIDPIFEGGAAVDDVWWRRTSKRSYYSVAYTLIVEGEAGATVQIDDVDGERVFEGSLDEAGRLEVPLMQMTIRPAEWEEGVGGAVGQVRDHQTILHTPHRVQVGEEVREVVMDSRKNMTF